MDWNECLRKRIAKNVKLDEVLVSSLMKTSENKLKSCDELQMNEVNASSKFSLAYDSLRELLEVLSLKKGFKIYNHECYSCFLKEVLRESGFAEEFDEIRKARNKVNYYGQDISIEESKTIILNIKKLRKFALDLFHKNL